MRGRRTVLFPLAAYLTSVVLLMPLHLAFHRVLGGPGDADLGQLLAGTAHRGPVVARDAGVQASPFKLTSSRFHANADCAICSALGHGLVPGAARIASAAPTSPPPLPALQSAPHPWLRHSLVPRAPPSSRS